MKKLFYSAAVALALCAWDARASLPQSRSVRVGPAAEEPAPDASSAPPSKKDDKKDEKKPAQPKPQESAKRPEQTPLANSTAAASTASAPSTNADNKSTSDAPAKPGSETGVPVGAPVRNTSGAEGAAESNPGSNRAAQPAPAGVPPTTNPNAALSPTPKTASPPPAVSPTEVYRIGIGDVLDIRLLNGQDPRQNTLYSVVAGGVLDYPLLRDPLTVAGMTTEELSAQLVAEFRHRGLYEKPQVRVSVREYASHAVLVSGLVNDPGTKILRREAIPLYVVVAESQPKPEAGRAVIYSRSSGKSVTVDLGDPASLNTLVQSGDVVTLTPRPPEFFYVGGEIGSPGQKDFHAGITLTQALLASGGVTKTAGDRVKVSRQGADGRLVSTEYSLREIEGGQVPDPALRPGDRVEVSTAAKRK